ncbi:ATP-binding protein [Actinoplanes aureus]|uniref:LuxR family transcriptional regulator n=1 Tax=Actinoplanes aureus TaxID=2792083 RepID=A0A931C4T4_9ACTN|nr:LuxR C-terminal-related transcriptional regulator [Actinoplanes aureus]MBG0561392.1 LuxR family transcriptional regulator [Actinoplanes aureus]
MPRTGGNLPLELTSFVGRRHEVAEVKRLLGGARLVTLTGVGGAGKTRLALRTADQLRRSSPDGVWFVDLTALRGPEMLILEIQDPDVLAYLVMSALGLREQAGAGSPTEQLITHLAGRRALLVLDNCEHLLPVGAVLAESLLQGCPGLRLLATSREPLLVPGEVLFAVPPLPTPQPGEAVSVAEVERYEGVALFVARTRGVVPGFALTEETAAVVAELCRRLDGLPLALELAAALVRVLAPGQILDRLTERFALLSRGSRTAPERQQTLRACADWSFELCAKPERVLWARLSVFAGGCELDAIEGICDDELLPAGDLLEVVAGLVDKSVLASEQVGGVARYRMLETLRDYGQEKLIEAGERDTLQRRHRDWYTGLARRFEADLISPRQVEGFARVGRELPNLRAALDYSLADPDGGEAALTIAASLYLYWAIHGLYREGRSWVDQALARPGGPTVARLKALNVGATLACLQGDLAAVSERTRQGYEAAAQRGDALGYAFADGSKGAGEMAGDLVEAELAFQRAAAVFATEPGNEYVFWRANVLTGLAITRVMRGDTAGAAAHHETILAICQPRGETYYVGFALWILGLGLWSEGDREAATTRLRESLHRLRSVDDILGTAWCLDTMAWIACDEGRAERAAVLLGAVTRLAHTMGARPSFFPKLAEHHEEYEQRTRTALGQQAYRAAFARGQRLSLDEAVAFALGQPPPQPAAVPAPVDASASLTRREREIAELLADGLSNREIAAKLVISRRTAETHVEHILGKLGLTNRAQVAAWFTAQR